VRGNLRSFCRKNEIALYSEKVGESYIEEKEVAVCKAALHNYSATIRRLNSSLT
jgi:hypothetical protein